jgi:hypothetical protein
VIDRIGAQPRRLPWARASGVRELEPSDHVYHLGDPAASIRRALACVDASR